MHDDSKVICRFILSLDLYTCKGPHFSGFSARNVVAKLRYIQQNSVLDLDRYHIGQVMMGDSGTLQPWF